MAGCSRPSHEMGDGKIPFTLEQAQDIFEREVVPATRSLERSSYRTKLSPGEFAPCWDEAVAYSEDGLVGFIMPIQAEFNVFSYKRTPDNIIHRPWRRVKQELIISRDIIHGKGVQGLRSFRCDRRNIWRNDSFPVPEEFDGS